MAYRKTEVRRESEKKIILITAARATQHIKRLAAKDIVPSAGDDVAVCARARSDASSADVGAERERWRASVMGGCGGEGRCNGLSSDVWHRYKRRGASSSSERLVVTHYICIYII